MFILYLQHTTTGARAVIEFDARRFSSKVAVTRMVQKCVRIWIKHAARTWNDIAT